MTAKGNAEYLPPLVTRLEGDTSGLRAAYTEALKLQEKYEQRTEGLNETLKETGEQADKSGKKITDFTRLVGDRMREGESAAATVRREYDRLQEKIKDYRKAIRQSDGDGKADLFSGLGEALSDLNKVRKIGTDIGMELGTSASKGFGGVISAAGPYGFAALIAAALTAGVVLAPAIGAAIGTALTIGLGAGVIGLGAMILGDDKQIKARAEKLAKTTSRVFQRAAGPLKGPFLAALSSIESGFKRLEPALTRMFEAAAPLVQPLADGFMGMLASMLPGITEALTNAKPIFDTLGEKLPIIGTAIGEFFRIISENKDASTFLSDLMTVIAGAIVLTAELVGALSGLYTTVRDKLKEIKDWFKNLPGDITKSWGDPKTWLWGPGQAVVQGFIDGIKSKKEELWGVLRFAVMGGVDAVTDALDSHSPSRVFMRIGRDTVDGYRIGVQRSQTEAWAAMAGLVAPPASAAGSYSRGIGISSAMGVRPTGGGAGTDGGALQPVILQIDGRTVATALIPHAQRYKARTGVTGLA